MDNETLNHLGVECLKDRIRDLERVLGRLMEVGPWDDQDCRYCGLGSKEDGHWGNCPWEDAEKVLDKTD